MSRRMNGGYVVDASGPAWLFDYRTPWDSPGWFAGEPSNFDGERLGHGPVSVELRARLATWAFVMMPRARSLTDPQEAERATRRADATGRMLAVMLRGEIGEGPTILYADQFHDPTGGPHCWEVTGEGALVPYFHRPSAGYVIDHEHGGEWAWQYRPASRFMIGSDVAQDERWWGEVPIALELVIAFSQLHRQWAKGSNSPDQFDWDAHNAQGLALSGRLKQALGPAYRIIYSRPYEQPGERFPWAVELRMDGTHRPFVHRPYWSSDQRTTPPP